MALHHTWEPSGQNPARPQQRRRGLAMEKNGALDRPRVVKLAVLGGCCGKRVPATGVCGGFAVRRLAVVGYGTP